MLISKSLNRKTLAALNEFSFYKTENNIKIEMIREYGKTLITDNAIKSYGVAFLKN